MEGDHKIYSAVGHCSVYDFSGQTYLFAHGYEIHDNGMPHLVKRKLNWDTDGWPIVMP
jgi:arabinan endo-1,5-alpha-L-arabinosidase